MDGQPCRGIQDPTDRGDTCHPHHVTSSVSLNIHLQPADGGWWTQRVMGGGCWWAMPTMGIYHFYTRSRIQAQIHGPSWRQVKMEICWPWLGSHFWSPFYTMRGKHKPKSASPLCHGAEIQTQVSWLQNLFTLSFCCLIRSFWGGDHWWNWAKIGKEVAVISQVSILQNLLHTPVIGSAIPSLAWWVSGSWAH